jgi:tRNA pseudouridine(38-40) synthase
MGNRTVSVVLWTQNDVQCILQGEIYKIVQKSQKLMRAVAGAQSLDADAMQKAADYLVGAHDFQHFCKVNFGNTISHHREILSAQVLPYPFHWQGKREILVLVIKGSGFLWHQVRAIQMMSWPPGMLKAHSISHLCSEVYLI